MRLIFELHTNLHTVPGKKLARFFDTQYIVN